jgi:hypothetical protein
MGAWQGSSVEQPLHIAAKLPEFKCCAVKVERVEAGTRVAAE